MTKPSEAYLAILLALDAIPVEHKVRVLENGEENLAASLQVSIKRLVESKK